MICRGFVVAIVSLVLAASAVQGVSAGAYVSLSIDQYHDFAPFERFMQYVPVFSLGWDGSQLGARVSFNLYERIQGPVSIHSVTPWTLESHWREGPVELQANTLVFIDVFDKAHPYRETMVEAKLRVDRFHGPWTLYAIPVVRAFDSGGWSPETGIGGGVAWRSFSTGVNVLDTKDYYLLGRGRTVATAQIDLPMANGNRFTIELHKVLGEGGRNDIWLTYRFNFSKVMEFRDSLE